MSQRFRQTELVDAVRKSKSVSWEKEQGRGKAHIRVPLNAMFQSRMPVSRRKDHEKVKLRSGGGGTQLRTDRKEKRRKVDVLSPTDILVLLVDGKAGATWSDVHWSDEGVVR